jgi:hypothetical protein
MNRQVYFRVCFGHVDFTSTVDPSVSRSVAATHHRAIRFVTQGGVLPETRFHYTSPHFFLDLVRKESKLLL